MECGLITEKCRGFFAKWPGLTASDLLTGHAALRDWPVHGPRLWTGAGALGPSVHRGPGAGRDRTQRRRGPRRRRHGRGAPARRGGATGLGESRRGHRRDAHVEAISVRVLAA